MSVIVRYPADIEQAYVSKDKLNIQLPVPLGSFLWEVKMGCDHICRQDETRFNLLFKGRLRNCRANMECCTVFEYIQRIKLDIDNIGKVLRKYEITIFDTKDKALEAGRHIRDSRIRCLRKAGIQLTDDGHVIK